MLAKKQFGNKDKHKTKKSKSQKYDSTERDTLLAQLDIMVSETRNPDTFDLDLVNTEQLLIKINQADAIVPVAIKSCIPQIGKAVDEIVKSFNKGGRLIYIGAGTSGRLGVLDAVECPPTFSVSSEQVIGIIAGGSQAIYKAVEGAEDSAELGKNDLINIDYCENDILVGVAASGRTPYVIGAIDYAKSLGTKTISISCNPSSQLATYCDINICAVVGPEVLTGSTRMKSGTAQKLILNMLSTASMIRTGKIYENLMVDVNASNKKLYVRAIRIVMQATHCDAHTAQVALEQTHYNAKLAILHILTNENVQDIQQKLLDNGGFLRKTLESVKLAKA
ncbi:N-acetylmuramic acid 6-phosphate etherase [Psychrosphaera aquimarina]|uniref:N-acetylmuramic acid 6-phosphate etherase n=1 Tax=Psychrosphaera aquimarina TaxID=2044854 RepID=UPI003D167A78